MYASTCYCIYSPSSGPCTPSCSGTAPSGEQADWVTFWLDGDAAVDAELRRRPRLLPKLKVPWKGSSQTVVAYPWDFDQSKMVPKDAKFKPARDSLLKPNKENVHWFDLKSTQEGWGSFDQQR